MDLARVPARRTDVLEAEVDGERVLMSGTKFEYFGLVGTGEIVWDRIDGSTSLGSLVQTLAAEFSADEAKVRSDVVDFVSALDAAGLLES